MVFEGLDGTFHGIDTVVVGLNELELAVMAGEEHFDGRTSLIVGNGKCGLESFVCENVEDLGVHGENTIIGCRWDGDGKDVVWVIDISDKEEVFSI